MRTKGLVFLAVACATFAHAAAAADLGSGPRRAVHDPSIPYGPAFSWTGLYIGANVGYGWSDADWGDVASGISAHNASSGWLLGGQIGYNLQVNHFVFGIEADMSSAWIDGSTGCPGVGFSCSHSFNWLASVRGRAGAAVNGNRTLLYVTAGGAWADVDYAARDVATGATFGSHSERHWGWVAGAGVEHMLTPNLTAKIEYLYYGFDTVTAPAGTLGGGPAALDLSTQTVRFGLNLKF